MTECTHGTAADHRCEGKLEGRWRCSKCKRAFAWSRKAAFKGAAECARCGRVIVDAVSCSPECREAPSEKRFAVGQTVLVWHYGNRLTGVITRATPAYAFIDADRYHQKTGLHTNGGIPRYIAPLVEKREKPSL